MIRQPLEACRVILYEYPFNERIRTYLRLEQLFQRLGELLSSEQALPHHYALTTVFEIMDVAARGDLKSDVLKDLEKQKSIFNSYRGNRSIAESVLAEAMARLEHCFNRLSALPGRIGQALADNEWLMGIRSRAAIPGGTCGFDLPAYHAWQHKDGRLRQQQLGHWVSGLGPLANAIFLLLSLLRDSGVPQKVMTEHGLLQQSLAQGRSYRLLRLAIDASLGLVPEISGNRLMLSVRLMRQDADGRLHNSNEASAFELTLCS